MMPNNQRQNYREQHSNYAAEKSDDYADSDDDRKVYVGSIDLKTTESDLIEHYGKFGEVCKVTLKIPNSPNRPAFAFILFKHTEAAEKTLLYKHHVINNKAVRTKRALSKHYKLYIGGVPSNFNYWDIKEYFKNYTSDIYVKMPYDYEKKERKHFCFILLEDPGIAEDILRTSPHVIKGVKVYVDRIKNKVKYDTKTFDYSERVPTNMSNERDFPPQQSYFVQAPCYFNIGYFPYNQLNGNGYVYPYCGYPYPYYYYPNYYTFTAASNQYEGYTPFSTNITVTEITEEQGTPEIEPVKDQEKEENAHH